MRILQGAKIQEEYNKRKRAAKEAEMDPSSNKNKKSKTQSNSSTAEQLKLRPGEKLSDFNRRVEQSMAHEISQAFRSESRASINARKRARRAARKAGLDPDASEDDEASAEQERKRRADKAAAKEAAEPSKEDLKRQRQAIESGGEIKDFAKASQVKKVTDVAQAPPKLTKAPRGESVQSKMRKAQLMAKITGNDEEEASRNVLNAEKARFKGRMPVAAPPKPSMARQLILAEERERAIKAYRQQKEQKIQQQEQQRAQKSGR